jgi:signal transduction histidine kinase
MRNERLSGALAVTDVLEHEIRQRLAALQLGLELLSVIAQGLADDKLQGQLAEIARNGKVSIEHVTTLLNRVRADAITRVGEPIDADAARVIEIAVAMSRAELARRAHCDVIVEGRPRVAIAPTELAQVLLNLLTNAGQSLPEGEAHKHCISIHLRTEETGALFTITDTGPGIAPENLERIFEPYFTTKPVGEGTGLGLPIVRQILERRDGEIAVESTPGKGTTFRVKIPLVVERPDGSNG